MNGIKSKAVLVFGGSRGTGRAATRIINEVKGINRVAYDVTSKAAGHDRVGVRPADISGDKSADKSQRPSIACFLGSGLSWAAGFV